MADKDIGTILIVDDNPLVLHAVTVLLEEYGYHCVVFSSAEEAIAASGMVPFDVVLTDINMPSVSGLNLLDKMRHTHPDKPGKLTPDEFEIMKTHTSIRHNMLDGSSQPVIQMAASIALTHHERWNGTGYPRGLKGKDIPMEGMITMIADQYDALRNKRPYKKSLSHKEAVTIITEGDGKTVPCHFSPEILGAFINLAPEFDEIFTKHNVTKTSGPCPGEKREEAQGVICYTASD